MLDDSLIIFLYNRRMTDTLDSKCCACIQCHSVKVAFRNSLQFSGIQFLGTK